MTYLQFLLVFILPILCLEGFFYIRLQNPNKRLLTQGLCGLVLLAVAYTTPWDNYLVKTQVWTYPPERVLGRIGYVPIEEYAFFVLQTLTTGLWCMFLLTRKAIRRQQPRNRLKMGSGLAAGLALWFVSIWFLEVERLHYLGLILSWSLPVLLLQWTVGAHRLLENLPLLCLCVLPPTVYLWGADAFAIHEGIWSISKSQTVGWAVWGLGLPVEEALFFFVTNMMVGTGLLLLVGLTTRNRDV